MNIRTESDFLITKWSGGTTTELVIFPEGSTLAERNFDWRISSAEVETEESDFTIFEGYERILIPLKGRLEMEHQTPNGVIHQKVNEFELARFNGSWPTRGVGKLTDFNVIFRPVYHPRIQITRFQENTTIPLAATTVLFLQEGSCAINNALVKAPALVMNETQQVHDVLIFSGTTMICVEMSLEG